MAEEKDLERDVEQAINQYIEWAAGLNMTLSEDEIQQKRNDLYREMGGGQLVPQDAGSREVESFDEVRELIEADPSSVAVVDDYQKLDDKSQLVNVAFFINRWWFTEGDMGDFAVMRCVVSRPVLTPAGETDKVVVTDGSTGIFAQLRKFTQKTQRTGNLLVRHGLRVSQYTADTESGPKMAETYYLT
jgi:hypothetical protein